MPGTKWPLGRLAERLGAELRGDPERVVRAIAPLAAAGEGDLSFLANRRYLKDLRTTGASAVILGPDDVDASPTAVLVLSNPYLGYAQAAALMVEPPAFSPGIHPSAVVDPAADVSPGASVGPLAFVAGGSRIGARARIGPGSIVGPGSVVGDDSRLIANVTVCRDVRIGARCLLHPGSVVGADGFGLANDRGTWVKIPQLGSVRIGDEVEVGANTTIDRGALQDTVVGDRVKIDNQVQIAHNVIIGPDTAVAGCVAIAGSVRIGARCIIEGAAMISGHLELADDVQVTGGSAVAKSITRSGVWSSGMPAQENHAWRKMWIRMQKLDDLARRLARLERQGSDRQSDD
jgi:UDP-3-O-[3-hydroxymyristoyl] glucosamine N-acyltransferase